VALREHRAASAPYLIPFKSLEARPRAWDAFNTDPDWHAVQANGLNVEAIILDRLAG